MDSDNESTPNPRTTFPVEHAGNEWEGTWEEDYSARIKGWVMTLNNWTEEEHTIATTHPFFVDTADYGIIAKEVGKQGVPHLQAYYRFPNVVRLSSLKAILPRAHFAPARSGSEFNFQYCSKGEGTWNKTTKTFHLHGVNANFVEIGKRPCFARRIKGEMSFLLELLRENTELVDEEYLDRQEEDLTFHVTESLATLCSYIMDLPCDDLDDDYYEEVSMDVFPPSSPFADLIN